MSDISLLSPSHFFNFFLFRIIIYKPKSIIFFISKGDNNYLPFQKTDKSINK